MPRQTVVSTPGGQTHVVVGIVFNRVGEVLIAERPLGKPAAGCWEFPGGKIEPGETPGRALVRELREELGIDVQGCVLTHFQCHEEAALRLDFYLLRPPHELAPEGCEGQRWRWVRIETLGDYTFPAPNVPIIQALQAMDR